MRRQMRCGIGLSESAQCPTAPQTQTHDVVLNLLKNYPNITIIVIGWFAPIHTIHWSDSEFPINVNDFFAYSFFFIDFL